MALLQFGADLAEEIAKMQDIKFDLFFVVECSIIGYHGGGCRNGAGILTGDCPTEDIQTQTPTTELATKQTTQAMMQDMVKGSNSLIPQTTLEGTLAQFATAYSSLPNATPELSGQFSELFRQFVKGLMDIIQRQGLTNGIPDE